MENAAQNYKSTHASHKFMHTASVTLGFHDYSAQFSYPTMIFAVAESSATLILHKKNSLLQFNLKES